MFQNQKDTEFCTFAPGQVKYKLEHKRMKFFPESALVQLEYEKVKTLLAEYCKTDYAKSKADNLRIHTKKDFIEIELRQGYEYKLIVQAGQYFPNDFVLNISRELKLLSIPGAVLTGEQFL